MAGTRATDFEKLLTRELYTGTLRNIAYGGAYVLNEEYYESEGVAREYTDDGERKNHFLFLHGEWRSSEESLDHARVSADFADYVGFRFYANEVNAVLNFSGGEPYRFRLDAGRRACATRFGGSGPTIRCRRQKLRRG